MRVCRTRLQFTKIEKHLYSRSVVVVFFIEHFRCTRELNY